MGIFDVFVAVIWGIVEGITEWLPVSSTGHMILVEEFLKFQDEQFSQMFLVVVQLGAILAVVLLFWSRIWPFRFTKRERGESIIDWKIMQMWFKIIVACLPCSSRIYFLSGNSGYVWCKCLKDYKEWIKLWCHGLCDFTRWYVSCLCGVSVCNPIPHELYP